MAFGCSVKGVERWGATVGLAFSDCDGTLGELGLKGTGCVDTKTGIECPDEGDTVSVGCLSCFVIVYGGQDLRVDGVGAGRAGREVVADERSDRSIGRSERSGWFVRGDGGG